MKIAYDHEFVKQFKKLPISIQRLFKKQEALFINDQRDSRLKIKKLHGYEETFSMRVTRTYRVLFILVEEDMIIFSVGKNSDTSRRNAFISFITLFKFFSNILLVIVSYYTKLFVFQIRLFL